MGEFLCPPIDPIGAMRQSGLEDLLRPAKAEHYCHHGYPQNSHFSHKNATSSFRVKLEVVFLMPYTALRGLGEHSSGCPSRLQARNIKNLRIIRLNLYMHLKRL